MAVIASVQIIDDIYRDYRNRCAAIKARAQAEIAAYAATTPRDQVINYMTYLTNQIAALDTLTGSRATELIAWAQKVENNPAYDPAAAYQTMRTAMVAARDWIAANFPKDAGGYVLVYQVNAGALVPGTFTAAQLTGLVAVVQPIVDAIT